MFRFTGTERTTPQLMDDQSNIELIEGFTDGNSTYLRFLRFMFPCNDGSRQVVVGTSSVIYAWNDESPRDGEEPAFHGLKRGSEVVNLMSGEIPTVPMPETYETVDLRMDNYAVPSADTTYYCKLMRLPDLDEIQHVVRIDPMIQEGNEGVVHHAMMYHCPDQYVRALRPFVVFFLR